MIYNYDNLGSAILADNLHLTKIAGSHGFEYPPKYGILDSDPSPLLGCCSLRKITSIHSPPYVAENLNNAGFNSV